MICWPLRTDMGTDRQNRMLHELGELLQLRFNGVQSRMARATGVSLPQLNRMLKGKMPVSDSIFEKIKRAAIQNQPERMDSGENEQAKTALYEFRRSRLREIIGIRFNGVNMRFADAIGMAQPSAHSIVNGKRNIGEKLARRLERLLSIPAGDLDGIRAIADIDEKDRFGLRRERLQQVVKEVFGGSIAACAQHMDVSEAYFHQMLGGQKTVGQMVARNIEKRLLLEAGTFDRLEEIVFPVRAISPEGRGIEIKMALLLALMQEHPADQKTCALLHGVVDVALERVKFTKSVGARVAGAGKNKISGNPHPRDTEITGAGKLKFVDSNV